MLCVYCIHWILVLQAKWFGSKISVLAILSLELATDRLTAAEQSTDQGIHWHTTTAKMPCSILALAMVHH